MTTNTTNQVIAAAPGPFSQVRTGLVASVTTNQVRVTVGGTTFPATYLEGATLAVGDLVVLLEQQGSWLILGVQAGVGPNLLADFNPSFEDSEPGNFPAQWFPFNISGVGVVQVQVDPAAPSGTQVANVAGPAVGSQSYLYSQPIPVTSGQIFNVSVYTAGHYQPTDVITADAALVALWFANATNLYPTTSAVDTVISSANDIAQGPPYTTLGGPVTAPVTGFMRIALRSTTQDSQAVRWDLVIVRNA